jgi:hypothetical protein
MGSVGGAGLLLVCFACKAAQGTPHLVIVPSSCTMLLCMHAVQACFVIRVCGGRDDGVGEGCALLGAWCEVVNMVTFWARVWHAPPPPHPTTTHADALLSPSPLHAVQEDPCSAHQCQPDGGPCRQEGVCARAHLPACPTTQNATVRRVRHQSPICEMQLMVAERGVCTNPRFHAPSGHRLTQPTAPLNPCLDLWVHRLGGTCQSSPTRTTSL